MDTLNQQTASRGFRSAYFAEAFSSPNGDSPSPTFSEQKPVDHIATACICLDGDAEGAVTALRLLRPTAIDQPQGASRVFRSAHFAHAFSSPNGDSPSPTLTEQKPVGHIATACICLDGNAEGAVTALRLLRPTAIPQPQGASRGFRSAYFAEAFSSPNGDSASPTLTEQKPVGHIATACICLDGTPRAP